MSSTTTRALRMGLAVLTAAALLAACGAKDEATTAPTSTAVQGLPGGPVVRPVLGPADESGSPQRGGGIVFGVEAEPDGLDPSRSTFDTSGHTLASAVFDPLATLDASGKAVPYLASALEPSKDFKEWTITLRENVTFHDGSKLDAEALKVNFDYLTASFITAPAMTSVKSYAVVAPLQLKVTMTQPWTSFPYTLTSQGGYVAAPSFLTNPDPNGPSMHPIGTGPFKYKEYTKGTSFTAERNTSYWQKDLPYLDQITFRFMPDALTRLTALTKGDIDILHAYQATVVTKAREGAAKGDLKAVENGEGEEDNIAINTEKEPFDDIVARQALAYATDAVKWRELAETNADHEVRGPFAKGQLGYSADDAFPSFDLAKATQLAKDYEKKHGHPIEAEVLTTGNIDDQAQMQLLIEQWGKAGIKVTIKTAELAGLVAAVVLGGYQLAGWRNFGSLDPDGDYLWWHSSAIQATPKISTNVARYKDVEIDKALDEARGTTDAATRQKDFEIVERRLNEGVAYVWLGRPTWVIAANPRVQGLAALANGSGATIASKTWLATLWITH
jgi:peptide/nickel transport system substrate-binding protein